MLNLLVKDFQSLSKVDIKVEGFTVIIGESSSGKTAIFRALYAAVTNRFRPSYVQNGKEYAYVILDFGEAKQLKVRKGLSGSPDIILGGLQFNKLNRTVPQEVQDFVNFGAISIGSDTYHLNFHSQFSKPLLLSFSQKKVMELLSSSKGIDEYNIANKKLNENRLKNKGAFDTLTDILANDKNNLSKVEASLALLEPIYSRYTKLYELYVKNTQCAECLNDISTLLESIEPIERGLYLRNQILTIIHKVDNNRDILDKLETLTNFIHLDNKLTRRQELKSKQLTLVEGSLVEDLSTIETLSILINKETTLTSKLSLCTNKLGLFESLWKLGIKRSQLKGYLLQVNTLEQLIEIHRNLNSNIKSKKSNICPMCGSMITNEEMKSKLQREVNSLTQELAINKSKIQELCEKLHLSCDENLMKNIAGLKETINFNLTKLEEEYRKIQLEIDKLDETY